MKHFILISLMITLALSGKLNYFKNCSQAVCAVPYAAC